MMKESLDFRRIIPGAIPALIMLLMAARWEEEAIRLKAKPRPWGNRQE
jgi:hypothetical protein